MMWRVGTVLLMLCSISFADAVPGEWIVRKERGISWSGLKEKLGSRVRSLRPFGPDDRFALLTQRSSTFKKGPLPKGVSVQPNYIYESFEVADPDFGKSWALQNNGKNIGVEGGIAGVDVNAVEAWKAQGDSKGALVAILDTGIDLKHEDLQKNIIRGWNYVKDTSDIQDDNNHGTSVAGVIGADAGNGKGTRGISNGSVLIVKMLNENGAGTTADAIRAIQYSVDKGAKIINISWGGTTYDPALYDTVKWTREKGVLIVAAAGNKGNCNDVKEDAEYPASFRLSNIISVSAYNNRDKLANFSNYGKETVHLGAPGVAIYSTVRGGYKFVEGTSFAAPLVAGIAALVWGKFPSLTAAAVKERLMKTSEPIGYYEPEFLASGGRVNAYNALVNFEPPRPKVPTQWRSHPTALGTPHPYANDFQDTIRVSYPGATHLRVHFSRFQVESKYDGLTVKDNKGRIVQKYTGDLGSFTSADALGDSMILEFKSDKNGPDWGFEIDSFEETSE
jgi:thermitase